MRRSPSSGAHCSRRVANTLDLTPLTIYTDGGCDPNPGPGGWGAVLVFGNQKRELCGAELQTTNNRMELTAAIEALRTLKRPCAIELYTDSQYLRRGMTEWVAIWQRRGWRTRGGKPVENQDLWQALVALASKHTVSWHWVRGHQGNTLNERADQLATRARRDLRQGKLPRKQAPTEPQPTPGLPQVDIFCHGSAIGNPGPGGYAAVVAPAGRDPITKGGGWPSTTNNIMELWAVIAGLRALKRPCRIRIHTRSKYVLDGATRWLAQWEENGWKTRKGQPVKNRPIWEELANVMGDHDIHWTHQRAQDPNMQAAAKASRQQAGQAAQKG